MTQKRKNGRFDVFAQCRRHGLSVWQCPSFLFLVMGLVIIAASLLAYFIGMRYIADPSIVALVALGVSAVLFIIATVIVRSFEKLAEASRLKSEFISVASHQLRSPLSNLKWATEMLMSGRLGQVNEKQTEYYRVLKENSARMAELVSSLLIVSRLETATLPINKKEVSLSGLISEIISNYKTFAQASSVEIELNFASDLPNVMADPDRLKDVIQNLLDNAVRYTKKGGKAEVSLEQKDKKVYFRIKDEGVGIPQEDQKYIFQKFFRSENVLKHQTQGSGLGLYISKSIIEKMGGRIGFSSQEDKGSTFWFALPIKQ